MQSKNFTLSKTPDDAYYVVRNSGNGERVANVTIDYGACDFPESFGAIQAVIMPFPGFYANREVVDLVLDEALRLSPRVWFYYSQIESAKHSIKKGSSNVFYVDRPAESTDLHPQNGGVGDGDDAAGRSGHVPGVPGLVDGQQPRESQSDGPAGSRDIPF